MTKANNGLVAIVYWILGVIGAAFTVEGRLLMSSKLSPLLERYSSYNRHVLEH